MNLQDIKEEAKEYAKTNPSHEEWIMFVLKVAQATRERDIEVVESFIKRQDSHPSISVKGDWIGQPPVVQSDDAARIAQALRNEEV